VLDPSLGAPLEEVGYASGAGDVTLGHILESGRSRPATVSVEHDRNVLRDGLSGELTTEPTFVDGVDSATDAHDHAA
jgi:hypothetical protein